MEIKQSEFITSAVAPNQYPTDNRAEIAFVGRSNVGKSSLINSLTNRRKLVKVSGTPGKTRLVNFFLINNEFYFVDLPGYGYAKVSKVEKQNWGKVIESYLVKRSQLKKIVLLLDCRHRPTEDDMVMYDFINRYGYKCLIVVTKSDKLNKNELARNIKMIKETLNLDDKIELLPFSSLNKQGKEKILENLENSLND